MTNYTIIGQRKLKVRADVVGTRRHNLREKLLPNVRLDGPAPVVIRGSADTWAELSARIAAVGVKPRKGAVLGIEILLTTSPGFWSDDEAVRALQVATVERLVLKYVAERFPPEALVQIVRHEDETSPHWHVTVAAIERKVDCRRKDPAPVWQLNAAGIVGHKPQMAAEHTRWARICAHLGLVRGRERSGEKNKPNHVYRAEMDAAIAAAAEREAKASALNMAAIQAEADALAERDRHRALSAEVEAKATALDDRAADLAAREADVARQTASLADREAALAAQRATLDERSERAAAWTKAAKAKEARLAADAQRIAAEDQRVRDAGAALVGEVMQIERISHLLAGLATSTDPRAREVSRLVDQLRVHVDAHARNDAGYGNALRVARAARLAGDGIAA